MKNKKLPVEGERLREPQLTPTPELAAIIAEVKEDIKHNRNLSPPIGKDELRGYLNKLR